MKRKERENTFEISVYKIYRHRREFQARISPSLCVCRLFSLEKREIPGFVGLDSRGAGHEPAKNKRRAKESAHGGEPWNSSRYYSRTIRKKPLGLELLMMQFEWKTHACARESQRWLGGKKKKCWSKRLARYASTMMNSGWLPRKEEPVEARLPSRCSMKIETFS